MTKYYNVDVMHPLSRVTSWNKREMNLYEYSKELQLMKIKMSGDFQ